MGSITLDPRAVEAIDDYMAKSNKRNTPPTFTGLERVCTPALRDIAEEVFSEKHSLVRLKGRPYKDNREWDEKYEHYFDKSFLLRFRSLASARWSAKYVLRVKCEIYYDKHARAIADIFVEEKYGNAENAVRSTESLLQMSYDFQEWFDERRKKFLLDMNTAIAEVKKFQMSEKPQSHGGVANLLKVLTKTMEKQNADITSIAKVQYAVCVQAGIYIPDEFVRDVAIAMSIVEDKEVQHGEECNQVHP